MGIHAQKKQEEKSQSQSKEIAQLKNEGSEANDFLDLRPEAETPKKMQQLADGSFRASKLNSLQSLADSNVKNSMPIQGKFQTIQKSGLEEEELLQGKFQTVQKVEEEEELIQGKFISPPKEENTTGLPDALKSGVESLSGVSLNDVKVYRNSDKPAQLQAHAYAQGTDIHLGPGQDQHLPHEAWHVVQQKQGRVKPTVKVNGDVPVNDSPSLEEEATKMGQKALKEVNGGRQPVKEVPVSPNSTAQLLTKEEEISLKTARPMTQGMKKTVGNQMSVNEQIRGFDKNNLRKVESQAPKSTAIPTPIPVGPTQAPVTRSTEDLKNVGAMPGISSILRDTSKGQAESDKYGNASYLQKGGNIAKNTAASASANLVEGAKDIKSKSSSIWGSIKEGASSLWGKTKSFFGFGPKEVEKPKHPDDPTTWEKVKGTGGQVLGSAAIEGASALAKGTVGKVGDIGAEIYKAGKSGVDAKGAHDLMKGREESIKGKDGSERDLGVALSGATRNEHIMQALGSGGKALVGAGGIAKTVITAGSDSVLEAGLDIAKGAAKSAAGSAVMGGVGSLFGGEKNAINERNDLTLGETFAGQSKSESENLDKFNSIVKGKGELSEESKKSAASARSALFKEGFDRSAGYNLRKKANIDHNTAQSMDTSKFGEKYDLERKAIQGNASADQLRTGVNIGANTLLPSDFKTRSKDLSTVKGIGADLKASDASFTEQLVQNEDNSHNRLATVSERIDGLKDDAYKKLRK